MATDAPSGGKAITVFEGEASPRWNPVPAFPAPLPPSSYQNPPSPNFLRQGLDDVLGCALDVGCQMAFGDAPGAALVAGGKLLGSVGAAGLGRLGLVGAKGVDALRSGEAGRGVVANGVRGRASEIRVLNELGLTTRNTTAVSTAEGRAIPDALTKSLSLEVKDAANVSLTRQLRIETEAARASGRQSILVTGKKTCVSGPCSRAFDTIIRRPDLGPQ